jgi:hypothetical protein
MVIWLVRLLSFGSLLFLAVVFVLKVVLESQSAGLDRLDVRGKILRRNCFVADFLQRFFLILCLWLLGFLCLCAGFLL